MGSAIFGCHNLTLCAALAKARTYHYASHTAQLLGYILLRQCLAVDEVGPHPAVVAGASVVEALQYALVGILQSVFSN